MITHVRDILLPDSAILLDVDGVLVDWATRCFEVCGVTKEEGYSRWAPGSFEIMEALGMTEEKMWENIQAKGSDFWEFLDDYHWAKKLYDHCKTIAPTYFLTSPSHDTASHVGKINWMKRFTGDSKFRNYLLGPAKHVCARKNNLLIDDYDKNVKAFKAAGGSTILFPQYWNENNAIREDPLPYVFEKLEDWIGEQFAQVANK
jgi:5'(3')-deoxyribonucleotidase